MLDADLSVLDLATVDRGLSIGASLAGSVALAQAAEQHGFTRVWYAEHHNFPTIASSATSVLIAHVAAHTSRIRLGAGGVMLPNHAPLTIAEQFGMLASLHPDRIDLGLGRAPGTDPATLRALRRDRTAADTFSDDVVELQGFLSDESPIPGVRAIPGRGTYVPLYLLGSSLFGAQLAAKLGLPYAFASHFAPQALQAAVAVYREQFQPSKQLSSPHVIAGVNVIAADAEDVVRDELHATRRARVKVLFGRQDRRITDEEADVVLESAHAAQVDEMLRYTAAGTPAQVRDYLAEFADHADADELIVAFQSPTVDGRLRSLRHLADVAELTPEALPPSES